MKKKYTNVTIKSNVTLRARVQDHLIERIKPIDNLPREYFSVLLNSVLNEQQRIQKEKMMFWAEEIRDENGIVIEDVCYKGCEDCGDQLNNCKRPLNIKKQKSKV